MDELIRPLPRRQALRIIGGTVLAGVAFPAVLEACAIGPTPTPVAASVAIDATTLQPLEPVEVPFTLIAPDGGATPGTAWLVREADGSLVAFDPRCTHAKCAYAWVSADAEFECHCHKAAFDITGKVLSGPPPRPLDRFPITSSADGTVELMVPGDFSTPRPEG
jgi:Rieske Fe-S protein